MALARQVSWILCLALAVGATSARSGTDPVGTSFSYQGRLLQNGAPANGEFDLTFNLFDGPDPFSDLQIGAQSHLSVPVVDGEFHLELDFGPGVFAGAAYWLEVEVRPAGVGGTTSLLPLQRITRTPYATDADTLDGMDSGDFLVSEADPEVGATTTNAIPKWSGSALVDSVSFFEDDAGKIGIGTSSPRQKLEVSGSSIQISNSGNTHLFIRNEKATEAMRNFTFVNEGGRYVIGSLNDSPGWTNFMLVMTENGNVGIGMLDPGNILTLPQGSSTDPIADAWTVYSSRRWKEDIQPLDGALDKILRLRGVTYERKSDGHREIGLIAEEVGEVVPEVVSYDADGTDARSLDYARLVAVLIGATKEQQEMIDRQQAEIEDLLALKALVCFDHPDDPLCLQRPAAFRAGGALDSRTTR